MSKSNDVFEGVQVLRFVAALLVAFMHCTLFVSDKLGGMDVWLAGGHGVGIFFVISGFVMYRSSRGMAWRDFVKRRLVRIVPLYWMMTIVKLAILVAIPALALGGFPDALYLTKTFLFLPAVNGVGEIKPLMAVGWTLNVEMFFYAIVALALALRLNVVALVSVVLVGCFLLGLWWDPKSIWALYLSPLMLDFLAGVLIGRYLTDIRMSAWSAAAVALFGGAALLLSPPGIPPLVFILASVLPAATLIFGVICLEPHIRGRTPRWLLLSGEASYSLYLVHTLVAPAVPLGFAILGINLPWPTVVLAVLISLIASYAVYLLLERPATRALQSALRRKPLVEAAAQSPTS